MRSGHRSDEGNCRKKVVNAPARWQQAAYATKRGISKRRACAVMPVARSARHYESRLIVKDTC